MMYRRMCSVAGRVRHFVPAVCALLVCALLPGFAGASGGEMDSAAAQLRKPLASDSAPPASPGARDLIQPEELARLLAGPAARRPAVLQVGFEVLYQHGHIAGSRYAGPASKPAGLGKLKRALRALPKQAPLVLYCGCCPWGDCPNVRPAFRLARESGYKNVKVMYVAQNMEKDWVAKGLPLTTATR